MTTIDPLAYPQRRCAAESSYPGSGRQCRRPAAEIRDGWPLCWQHAAARSVTYPEDPAPMIRFEPGVNPPTLAEDLVESARADIREGIAILRTQNDQIRELVAIAASPDSEDRRIARLEAMLT